MVTDRIWMPCRLFRKVVQQGRSEVRDATKKERHACGRARVGERPVSQRRIVLVPYGEPRSDARTLLADFVNSLLGIGRRIIGGGELQVFRSGIG